MVLFSLSYSAKKELNNDKLFISVIKRKFAHSWRVLQNGRRIIYSGELPLLVNNNSAFIFPLLTVNFTTKA
mgnify:CR=1 FL=1